MTPEELQSIRLRFGIIGNSPLLTRAIEIAAQVAVTDLSVLVTGESGSGKEHFPKIIHEASPRKHNAYFAINCGAIPESLIDSELFGHVKGSFTGAVSDHKGYFEVADGGTLFLDEVGELPLETQVRLLRVLETGEFLRVGDSKVLRTNVRVVAATNLDIPRAIHEGRFREDLYYRLNAVQIQVPPLRERRDDIPLLFRKFASDFSERYRMPRVSLTEDAKRLLQSYYWAGNIRQLKNVAEQVSILETDRTIDAIHLKPYLPDNEIGRAPVLKSHHHAQENAAFSGQIEMLYNAMLSMRAELDEIKKHVNNGNLHPATDQLSSALVNDTATLIHQHTNTQDHEEYLVAEEYDEESYPEQTTPAHEVKEAAILQTMGEVEKETIRRSLEKNKGSRKLTASELQISERTLYRKIREYGL